MQNSVARTRLETLQWLAEEYHDLNGSHYEILDEPPSPLEFGRLVHISRPVVIKGFQTPASLSWTNEYLIERMGNKIISVAVTPNGHADAVTKAPDGRRYFVEPHVEQMTMSSFLTALSPGGETAGEICYLQSQNGNMYTSKAFELGTDQDPSEFEALRPDVPMDISWCSEALGRKPDAVNLWVGDSRSITSVHSDPYENIYTVIRGSKHFTLFPPVEGWCLEERSYPHATYTRSALTSTLGITPSSSVPPVRWSSIQDPSRPENLPYDAHPMHVTLREGDTLYLPAGWWHHVRQSGDVTIALNWWYDVEIRGMTWVWLTFLRGPDEVQDGNEDELLSFQI